MTSPSSPLPSSPSPPPSSSSAASAFDNRDPVTKAKFLAMIGGGGKGGGAERKAARKSSERKTKPLTAAHMAGEAAEGEGEGGGAEGDGLREAPATLLVKKKKGGTRSPKASDSSASPSSSSSSSPLRPSGERSRGSGKAAALTALSSRLKGAVGLSTSPAATSPPPQSANGHSTQSLGGSLLDPSPSGTATAAFSSPAFPPSATSKGRGEDTATTAENGAGRDEPLPADDGDEVDAEEGEEREAREEEGDDEEDEEDEDGVPTAADGSVVSHVEPSDAVKGVERKELLEEMDRNDRLQSTLPWNQRRPSQPLRGKDRGGGKGSKASSTSTTAAAVSRAGSHQQTAESTPPQRYGSLVPSPDQTNPSTPVDEADSPLTVANDYDLPSSAAPLPPPSSSSSSSSASASSSSSTSSPQLCLRRFERRTAQLLRLHRFVLFVLPLSRRLRPLHPVCQLLRPADVARPVRPRAPHQAHTLPHPPTEAERSQHLTPGPASPPCRPVPHLRCAPLSPWSRQCCCPSSPTRVPSAAVHCATACSVGLGGAVSPVCTTAGTAT